MVTRVYFSQVLGKPVLGLAGDRVGSVADAVVRLVEPTLPRLTGILLRVENRDVFVSIDDLARLTDAGLELRTPKLDMRAFERRPGEVLLARDVRGGAVIDVEGARLVRVRDVVLEGEGKTWHIAAVVSAPPRTVGEILRNLVGRQAAGGEEIPWTRVEPLVGHVPTAGLRLPFGRLSQLRPADIADIVEQASHHEGEQILSAVQADPELEADVFEELSEDKQIEFLHERSDDQAASVLANMNPDDAADLLMEMDQGRRKPVLEALPEEQQVKVRALLGYGEETAGGLMSPEFVALPEATRARDALQHIREMEEPPHILTVVYTLDGGRLSGAITLVNLVRSDPEAVLGDVAEKDPIAIYPDADIPAVALEMADYNLSSLPVVDEESHILGVITYDDVIEKILPEDWRWRGRSGRAVGPSPAGVEGEQA